MEELIIMTSFEEKKFRDKPYTQCFECIQGNRLKCKQCMSSLVQEIIRQRKLNTQKSKRIPYVKKTKTTHKLKHSSDSQLQIKTSYGLWMDNVYFRRTKERNPLSATLGCWPHKKNTQKTKKFKVQSPKFQSWSGRLYARISKAEQHEFLPNRGNSMRA